MRLLAAILGIFIIVLAGCVTPAEPVGSGPMTQATFGTETGAIKGSVVDDSLMPVAGVLVGLDDANATISDKNGAFAFSGVAPGAHRLTAQGVAIEPVAVSVEVVAQEVTEVTIAVQRVATEEAYHETVTQDGITSCGTSIREPGQSKPSYLQICGVLFYAGLTDYDRFRLDWQVPMPGLMGMWAETVWTKNSAASGGYNVLWDVFGSDGNIYDIGSNGSAQSPLHVRIERDVIDAQVKSHGDGECKADGECHIASFHANYGETLGPDAPADAAVSVMQRYSVYLTKFYNGELPESFTAVADS